MIKTNCIRCLTCGDIIASAYRHDYNSCSCGRVSVDGGLAYFRRGFKEGGDYEDLSVFEEEGL